MGRAAPSALNAAVRIILPIVVASAAAACAPGGLPGITLPAGAGVPRPDVAPAFATATAGCRGVRALTADLALSGSAGRQKLRGHILAGFAPNALRLEGVAPFGGPVFILAAENGRGALLLPRDRRAVQSAAPGDILEALVGVRLSPDDLLAALTGCVKAAAAPASGAMYGADWLVVELTGGGTAYLRRKGAEWPLVAAVLQGLRLDYGAPVGRLPEQVRIRTADPRQSPPVDLQVRLQSVDANASIDPAAFSLVIPPGTTPMTVQELRESYHR
jgi:hypothetical protein